MILGFSMSFLNAIFIALPIFLAAKIFNNVLSHKPIYMKDILNVVIIMVLLVIGRFITAYFKSKSHESIAYEMSAKERLDIGDKLKNVRLGYFNSHHSNELTTIVTTDLTFLENFAMKMVDVVVNGYILITVLILSLLVVSWQVSLLACIGVLLSFFAIQLLERKSRQNAPAYHNVQNQLVEKVLEVIRGIQVIKSFAKENASLKSFNQAVNESKRINTKMDGGAMFGVVPKPLWSKQYNANERNQINLPTHPILIQTAQYNLIIDAGIGNGKLSEKQLRNFGVDEESHIIADLANYNLTPKDIDYVLMTHMHFDHAAGLTDQAGHAIFENAIHVVQQDEWHEFIAPNIRSKSTYWDKNKGDYSNKLILFEKHFEPVPGIKMQHSGGHSFGHTIITIESQGDKAVHMGDIFPTTAHKNPLWVTAYDDYPMQSIREKERMIPYFIQQQYWFLFYHDENYFAVKYSDDGENIDAYILRETLVDNN
ncbi:ABC transporter transmembrane domain-containing protein [Staphylococcus aureus]